jgi:hypothetical protein
MEVGPMARMSRAALIAAGLAIAGCQSEPQTIPVAKDPVAAKPTPSPAPSASATTPPGLVDDNGSAVAEYGAPAPPPPPKPTAKPDAGLVDDHGGMHSKYGAPPPPSPKPKPPGVSVPLYGMPSPPPAKLP